MAELKSIFNPPKRPAKDKRDPTHNEEEHEDALRASYARERVPGKKRRKPSTAYSSY